MLRCGRPTAKTSDACRLAPVAGFDSCHLHLTKTERRVWQQKRRQFGKEARRLFAAPVPAMTACHQWSLPQPARLPPAAPSSVLRWWQQERCAICGHHVGGDLVQDHCHHTGLVRGWLCRGCNTQEGVGWHPGVEGYRLQPPAVRVGFTEPYPDVWGPAASAQVLPYHRPPPTNPRQAARFLQVETYRAAYWRTRNGIYLQYLAAVLSPTAAAELANAKRTRLWTDNPLNGVL